MIVHSKSLHNPII